MQRKTLLLIFIFLGCLGVADADATRFQFWQMSHFDRSTCALKVDAGRRVLLTPVVIADAPWDRLIVSWNADTPKATLIEIWVRGGDDRHWTHWYSMGRWTAWSDNRLRTSRKGQKDADGEVKTDTLVLKRRVPRFQIRVVTNGSATLRFLGVSLTDSHVTASARPANCQVWGRDLPVSGVSQLAFPDGEGWCSPAGVSMVLNYWASQCHEPRWHRTVPQCAAGSYDKARDGTGNWVFNTAYAGSLPGIKAYVTRLPDIRALEDWVAQGVPVVLAVSVDLHSQNERPGPSGHLIVCTGFTKQGDLVVNDPWTHLKRGESIRRIVPRGLVSALWAKSDHTVYIIHPIAVHPWQEANHV